MTFDAFQHDGFQPGAFQEVAAAVPVFIDGMGLGAAHRAAAEMIARRDAEHARQDAVRAGVIADIASLLGTPPIERRRRLDALWLLDLIDDDEWIARRAAA